MRAARMRVLEMHYQSSVSHVTYGRTGRQLVAAAGNRHVIWNLEAFQMEREIFHASRTPMACLFVAGGGAFLGANGYWPTDAELPPFGHVKSAPGQPAADLASLGGFLCFGSDGQSFLRESFGLPYRSPQRLALWDFVGQCVAAYPLVSLVSPRHAAFSLDGKFLAIGGSNAAITLLHATSGEPFAELGHTDQLHGLTFSPDGRYLATSAGRLVRIWSVPGGECVHRFRAFQAHTTCRAFSPDGKLLVSGSREGRARIWEVDSGREISDHNWDQGDIQGVAFSPDGLTAAAACRNSTVVIWDVDV